PPFVYFHSTTALSGQKFLVVGGVQYTPGTKKLDTVDDKNVYLLTLGSDDKITVEKIGVDGGSGRFFHTAVTADNINVTVLGGFTENRCDLDLKQCTATGAVCDENAPCVKFVDMAKGDARFFDLNSKKLTVPASDEPYLSKACHKAVVLQDDTTFLVGGLTSSERLKTDSLGFLELYAPSNIALDLVPKQ
ncbi:MAG: hypothetical protein FJ088_10630, partial [Deltaproteobacteria bacterium]|nr:hypothetical protein [Deltaproteobacteria bacterium]